jgi:hypothetical protein
MKSQHGHMPEQSELYTGFIAYGNRVTNTGVIDRIELVDIAPNICKLLGLPADNMDGSVLKELVQK